MPERIESFPFETISQVNDTIILDLMSHRFARGKLLVRMAVGVSGKIKFVNLMRVVLYDYEEKEVVTYFNPTAEMISKRDYPQELADIYDKVLDVILENQQFKPKEGIVLHDGFDIYNRVIKLNLIFE